jgi:hypothetical protein
MDRRLSRELDRYITGNYGEDAVRDDDDDDDDNDDDDDDGMTCPTCLLPWSECVCEEDYRDDWDSDDDDE